MRLKKEEKEFIKAWAGLVVAFTSILTWRIKRLEKKKSKLKKEYKMWQTRYWFYDTKGNDEMKDEILWCLAYVDDELGRTMRKLRQLKRKLKWENQNGV